MATKSETTPSVSYAVTSDGSHAIGVTLGGVFVPFVKLEGAYVTSLIAAGKSPEAQEAAGTSSGDEE